MRNTVQFESAGAPWDRRVNLRVSMRVGAIYLNLFEFVSQFCVVTSCYYRKIPNLRVILADITNKCPTVAHSVRSRCIRVSSVAIQHLFLMAAVLVNDTPDSRRVRKELWAIRRNVSLAVLAYGIDVDVTKDRILTKNRRNSVIFGRIRPRIGAFESARRPANLEPTHWRGSDSDHAKCGGVYIGWLRSSRIQAHTLVL
jgi:hypothetical protein